MIGIVIGPESIQIDLKIVF